MGAYFGTSSVAIFGKAICNILDEAGLPIKETEYYLIAAQMTKEEIHPEVVEKLDAIAEHFDYPSTTP